MTNSIFSPSRVLISLAALGVTLALVLSFVLPYQASAAMLFRQLDQGMSGADVSSLQTFLAADPSIYPQGLVTGFFGPLTFSAVSNFQSHNGIASVGRVGPITLAAINSRMGGMSGTSDRSAPLITSITLTTHSTSMDVTWTTNELASSAVYYSLAPIALTDGLTGNSASVAVSGTPVGSTSSGLRASHNVNVPNLQAATTYYYVIQATDQTGNVSVTWPTTFTTSQ